MAKPWVIVGGTGYDLEDIDNPRTREMECPSCSRRVRFIEKDLVKNLKVLGVSLVGVEEPRRVFACPSCNTAVEPPPDAGLASTDPKVVAVERRIARAREDVELWSRRADLADKRGDDVLAREARAVVDRARAELAQLETELARLTAWDEDREEKPTVVARVRSSGAGAGDAEGAGIDRAFAALKSKLAGVASAVAGPSADEQPAATGEPPAQSARVEAARREREALDRAADDELASLKARMRKGPGAAGAEAPREAQAPATVEVTVAGGAVAGGPAGTEAPPTLPFAEPSPTVEPSSEERYARAPRSADELGVGLDYVPRSRRGSAAIEEPSAGADGPANPTPPPADDDPVSALKRKLKKPGPGV
jgi:hypothetical protein